MILLAALVLPALSGAEGADVGEGPRGLDPASCGLLRTIAPLGGELYGVSFSPDGGRVAVGCGPGVRIFDVAGGREAGRLEGHPQHVYSTAWSPDGRRLAGGGFEGAVQVWDVATGKSLQTLNGHDTFVAALAFSPDGRQLLSGAMDGSLRAWDLEANSGRQLPARPGAVTDAVFAGGRALTTGLDGRVHVWKPDGWELERTADLGAAGAQGRWFGFSPGGRRVAGLLAGTLLAGDAEGATPVRRLPDAGEGGIVRPFPDGRHLLVAPGPPGQLRIVDILQGRTAAELPHHAGNLTSLAVHPSGRLFATTGSDRHLKLWGRVAGGMSGVRPKGFLGVRITVDAAGTLLLADVIPGTAAERAGLRQGDVVRRIGGKAVTNPTEATDQIGSFQEGDEVEFVLERDGQERTSRIKLGRRPQDVEQ